MLDIGDFSIPRLTPISAERGLFLFTVIQKGIHPPCRPAVGYRYLELRVEVAKQTCCSLGSGLVSTDDGGPKFFPKARSSRLHKLSISHSFAPTATWPQRCFLFCWLQQKCPTHDYEEHEAPCRTTPERALRGQAGRSASGTIDNFFLGRTHDTHLRLPSIHLRLCCAVLCCCISFTASAGCQKKKKKKAST